MATYYDELEVSPKASPETVRAAYRSLIQRFHPDRHLGSREFALRTQRVNDAYAVLSNSEKRASYDAKLLAEDVLNRAQEEARRRAATESAARVEAATAELRRDMEAASRAEKDALQKWTEEGRRRQATEGIVKTSAQAKTAARQRTAEAEEERQRTGADERQQAVLHALEVAGPWRSPPPRRYEPTKPPPKRGGFISGLGKFVSWGIVFWIAAAIWDDATSVRTPQPKSASPAAAAPARGTMPATRLGSTPPAPPRTPPQSTLDYTPQPRAQRYESPLSTDDEVTIGMACSQYQMNGDVAGYQGCVARLHIVAANTPPGPDMSGLDTGVSVTIGMACNSYQMNGDLVGHRACLSQEYAKVR
jgi:curved DNA-binding protein CbpA